MTWSHITSISEEYWWSSWHCNSRCCGTPHLITADYTKDCAQPYSNITSHCTTADHNTSIKPTCRNMTTHTDIHLRSNELDWSKHTMNPCIRLHSKLHCDSRWLDNAEPACVAAALHNTTKRNIHSIAADPAAAHHIGHTHITSDRIVTLTPLATKPQHVILQHTLPPQCINHDMYM